MNLLVYDSKLWRIRNELEDMLRLTIGSSMASFIIGFNSPFVPIAHLIDCAASLQANFFKNSLNCSVKTLDGSLCLWVIWAPVDQTYALTLKVFFEFC
jgi:hypothetical protein